MSSGMMIRKNKKKNRLQVSDVQKMSQNQLKKAWELGWYARQEGRVNKMEKIKMSRKMLTLLEKIKVERILKKTKMPY